MKISQLGSQAPPSLSLEALNRIRSINRDLLIAAGADISDEASQALDIARQFVLSALAAAEFANGEPTSAAPERWPVPMFKAAAELVARKFELVLSVSEGTRKARARPLPSKLNGRRNRQFIGCL